MSLALVVNRKKIHPYNGGQKPTQKATKIIGAKLLVLPTGNGPEIMKALSISHSTGNP